jgi:hypothetical protein
MCFTIYHSLFWVCYFPLDFVSVFFSENRSVNVAESYHILANLGVRVVRGLITEAFYRIKYFTNFTRLLQKILDVFFISLLQCHLNNVWERLVCRDNSVGIAIRCGRNGPGIESRCGRDFLHPSRPALGSTQPPIQGAGSLPEGKAAWAWRWPPTPIQRRGQRKSIHLFPFWAYVAYSRVNFTFYLRRTTTFLQHLMKQKLWSCRCICDCQSIHIFC